MRPYLHRTRATDLDRLPTSDGGFAPRHGHFANSRTWMRDGRSWLKNTPSPPNTSVPGSCAWTGCAGDRASEKRESGNRARCRSCAQQQGYYLSESYDGDETSRPDHLTGCIGPHRRDTGTKPVRWETHLGRSPIVLRGANDGMCMPSRRLGKSQTPTRTQTRPEPIRRAGVICLCPG